jgi:hypothetical protein
MRNVSFKAFYDSIKVDALVKSRFLDGAVKNLKTAIIFKGDKIQPTDST